MSKSRGRWPQEVCGDLCPRIINEREVMVFPDAEPSLYHMLCKTAGRLGDKTALVDNWGRRYSYSRFLELTDRFAAVLSRDYQVERGSHVGLLLYNGVEFCVAFLALCKLGAVTVPLPGKYRQPEVLSLAEKAEVTHMICDDAFYDWFDGMQVQDLKRIRCANWENGYGFDGLDTGELPHLEAQGGPEDPVIIMFTSGTTSRSKGVLLKNYNVAHAVVAYQRTLGVTEQDRSVIATPIYHVTGMIALLGLFIRAGGTLFLHKKVDAARILSCIRDEALTFLHASPTVFHLLLDCREQFPRLPSMRCMACGSSNMPLESIRRLKAWMPRADFHTVYGLTETSSPATIFPCGAADSPYLGASGIPIPGLDVRIADEDGYEVAAGETGEILLRGTVVLEHYYNLDSDAVTGDGWLKSGDLGHVNADGYLWVSDRKKDMINRGGEKICTFDVENELCSLTGVLEAAVVGVSDSKYGEVPVAALRLQAGTHLSPEQIRQALSLRMARYKIPERYLFLDAFPLTANGKVDKKAVRALFA